MTNSLWDIDELSKIFSEEEVALWEPKKRSFFGISSDSRSIKENDLFFALRGPNFDARKFIDDVLEMGCGGVIFEQDNRDQKAGLLPVSCSGLSALTKVSAFRRKQVNARCTAVCGSFGKTTIKNMILMAKGGKTHGTLGNLNNEIGVPLTLASMSRECTDITLEAGMSNPGELSRLSKLINPDVLVMSTIAPMHMAGVLSIDGLASAKSEAFDGLKDESFVLLSSSTADVYLEYMLSKLNKKRAKVLFFGNRDTDDARVISVIHGSKINELLVKAVILKEEVSFCIKDNSVVNACNAVGAITASVIAGFSMSYSVKNIDGWCPTSGRGRLLSSKNVNGDRFFVIDDSYNAGPLSVVESLRKAIDIKQKTGGRILFAIGDMQELGTYEEEGYKTVSPLCAQVDRLFGIGRITRKYLIDVIDKNRGYWFDSVDEFIPFLNDFEIMEDDILLVKGSNSNRMSKIISHLECETV